MNAAASTLPSGWICQFDPKNQRLFYIYQPTGQTTWAHPLGQAADAQENARYLQFQHQQQQPPIYMPVQPAPVIIQQVPAITGSGKHHGHSGPSTGAALAVGAVAGGAAGIVAGSLLSSGLHHNYGGYGYGYGGEYIPAMGYGGGGGDVTIIENNNYGGGNDVTIIENNNYGGGNDVTIIENNDYGGDFGGGDFGGDW
ncbi:hypothetical protein BGX29_009088 [Mortierella sp. GBA35]|nr:hypothetical protein BGX29_009088 [Mortierella sp. GBA35]